MKKFLLISVLFGLLILTGCSNKKQELELLKQQNTLLQSQIDQQKNEKTGKDLFEKKQECMKYKNGIIEKEKELVKYVEPGAKGIYSCGLYSIFYSPTLDTCLYAERCTFDGEDILVDWKIHDILADDDIYTDFNNSNNFKYGNAKLEEITILKEQEWVKKVQELQGE